MNNQLNTLIDWVQATRQHNEWLDNEADALLRRLQQWQLVRYYASAAMQADPACVLRSATQAPFSSQLAELLANDQQRITIMLDGTTLEYSSHILPCLSETSLAVRFTDKQQPCHGPYVLTLTLMSTSDKARRLIALHAATVREEDFRQCLTQLEKRKLPSQQGIIDSLEFLSITDIWAQCVSFSHLLSPTLVLRASELVPFLNQEDLTKMMALFWGGSSSATTQWRQHLHIQTLLEHAPQVIVPARAIITSCVISHLAVPQSITDRPPSQMEDIPVCPLIEGVPLPVVSLQRQTLFDACREITLKIAPSNTRLSTQDIVILPASPLYRFDLPYTLNEDVTFSQQQEKCFSLIRSHLNYLCQHDGLTQQAAEALLRALQTRSDRHGELLDGLAINEQALEPLTYPSVPECEPSVFRFAMNLFDETLVSESTMSEDNFAARAYRCWINHIREKGFDVLLAERCGLAQEELQSVCQILILTSYKTDMRGHLANALVGFESNSVASMYCATRILNEFTTWLGYDRIAAKERPQSKINHGTTLFSPPSHIMRHAPLPNLDTVVHSNISWLGDWLIALLNRATELPSIYGLTAEQRRELGEILPHL